jgi:hypothetical protein
MLQRFIPVFVLILVLAGTAGAGEVQETENRFNALADSLDTLSFDQDDLKALELLTERLYKWKVEESEGSYVLSVDKNFVAAGGELDYVTLVVYKKKGKERPRGMRFIFGPDIDFDRNMSLLFGRNRDEGSMHIDISEEAFWDIPFTARDEEVILADIHDMYVRADETQDLYLAMTTNDFMFIEVVGTGGQGYSIMAPLLFFHQALEGLE